ncbi:hypothetical protein [Methyloglobulus morosus]|nr:hypothetical protein [Methyloglobulus morosus]
MMPELRLPAKCFATPEDEDVFFTQLPPVTMAYPDIYEYVIDIEDELVTEDALCVLLELFRRYDAPLGQFAVFETVANRGWFRDPEAWWYEAVFGSAKQQSGLPATLVH